MKDKRNPKLAKKGPEMTHAIIAKRRTEILQALAKATRVADRRGLLAEIADLNESLEQFQANPSKPKAVVAREFEFVTDREWTMAKLARKLGRGYDAIYHGTRYLPEVLRDLKLEPTPQAEFGVFFSRSPEAAARFSCLLGEANQYSPGMLVLNRSSLIQNYALHPSRYDEGSDIDEREEVIWNRAVDIARHLLGHVSDAEVTSILGPPRYVPFNFSSWPIKAQETFIARSYKAGHRLVHDGRAKVRAAIVREQKQLALQNARSPVRPTTFRIPGTVNLSAKSSSKRK